MFKNFLILRTAGHNSWFTKVWNLINRIVLNKIRPRATSWFCSILLLLLGNVVIFIPVTTQQDNNYISSLLVTLPQIEWGILIIIISLVRLTSLISHLAGNKSKKLDLARVIAGMLSCYIWTQLVINNPAHGVEKTFETIVYAWIVFIELWNVTLAIVDMD